MQIRRFIKNKDNAAWAIITDTDPNELEHSMLNPEFNDTGMLVGEVDGQIVGTINAHINRSYPSFCTLHDFKVKTKYWNQVAPALLDAALGSFVQRNANTIEAVFSEDAESHISLLQNQGFQKQSADCRMKHDLKNIPSTTKARVQIKEYSELRHPDLIVDLQNKVFSGLTGRPVTKEEFLFWVENPGFACFVAFYGDSPAASTFSEIASTKGEKQGWIYGLGVLPAYRREGIGTTLLAHVLNHLKTEKADVALIETDYASYQQRFYESAGFHLVNKIICLRKALI